MPELTWLYKTHKNLMTRPMPHPQYRRIIVFFSNSVSAFRAFRPGFSVIIEDRLFFIHPGIGLLYFNPC